MCPVPSAFASTTMRHNLSNHYHLTPEPRRKQKSLSLHVLHNASVYGVLEAAVAVELTVAGVVLVALVATGTLAHIFRRLDILADAVAGPRHENDLAVGRLGHGLHGLEVADLHGGRAGQDVGGLAHELGALDFGACRDDFGLTRALGLRCHRQRVLQSLVEDQVLDQHALHFHTPA